jgi:hypothetical protein
MTEPVPLALSISALAEQVEHAQDRWPVVRTGEREPIDDGTRLLVKLRDGFACVWCYRKADLVLDHIVPWSAGGSDHPTNLRTLCWTCNEHRSNRRYAGDTDPRLPFAIACTRCDPPEEDDWNGLLRAWCLMCRRPCRALPQHVDQAPASDAQAWAELAARQAVPTPDEVTT